MEATCEGVMTESEDVIRHGKAVIIQRGDYMRVHTFSEGSSFVSLGRDKVNVSGILGHKYGTVFEMFPEKDDKFRIEVARGGEKPFEEYFLSERTESGEDNRNITGDGQTMSRDDVEKLRESGAKGSEIVGKLIESSTSFNSKTKFSQAKFLKKKARKYYPYIVIHRTSIRLLMEIYYKYDPIKLMNLRIDTLAQMLNLSNLQENGRFLVYENGCRGIVVAAALERIGPAPDGKLIQVYETGTPQNQSIESMNFTQSVKDNLLALNLSHFQSLSHGHPIDLNPNDGKGGSKRELLRAESMRAYDIMKDKKLNGLIIASKHHPNNVLLSFMEYLAPSSCFVVYCPYKEPLVETYMAVKETGRAIMVSLTESWLRYIQVLPERTHPEVLMSGGGGYLLSGIKVDNS